MLELDWTGTCKTVSLLCEKIDAADVGAKMGADPLTPSDTHTTWGRIPVFSAVHASSPRCCTPIPCYQLLSSPTERLWAHCTQTSRTTAGGLREG